MDFLVTGATGFIGRKIVGALLAGGHEVVYLARKRSAELDSRAAFHLWEPGAAPPLATLPTLDAIVHLAGEPIAQRWSPAVKREIYESRVGGTHRLVSAIAALKHKPAVLVSASATGYYGHRGSEILNEASGPGADFLARLCIDWEREALRARDSGVRVVTIRVAPVLGRDGGAFPRMLKIFGLGLGGKLGSGHQWMPWIHIEDIVRLFLFAAETQSVSGVLNGSSPQPVTNEEFTRTLARVLHRPAVLPVPRVALRLALGELANYLFDSARVIPEATQNAGFAFEYPGLETALKALAGR